MASSMKDIKLRIHSVQNTMQITKAMELVASSKLRRAQEQMAKSRPHYEALYETLGDIAAADSELSSPYIGERDIAKTCWIVIAGDRGLAGGYNSNVLRMAAEKMAGCDSVVVPIGKKAVEFFRRRGVPFVTAAYAEAADVSVSDCFTLARTLCDLYRAGEFGEIHIVFTSFVSVLVQNPSTLQLLPLSKETEPVSCSSPRQVITYEPDSETVYNAIVPEYLGGVVYGALCESVASELGARRTAMDAATKNAGEMIDDLNLKYNRARQGAITQEITEIVAGAQDE